LVDKVRAALNIRFGAGAPNVLFVDRGKGFYDPGTGKIVGPFKTALRDNQLAQGVLGRRCLLPARQPPRHDAA